MGFFMKKKKESVFKSIFSLLLSQILIKVIGLVYKLYLTNKEGFGDLGNAIYSSGFQIYALLLTFSSTGVPNAISKLVAERVAVGDNKGANKIFKISFITFGFLGLTGSILLFLGAKKISLIWMQIPEAEYSLMALSPSIFFVSISAVIRGYYNGMQNFVATAKSQAVEQVFKTFFTIVLVEIMILIGRKNVNLLAAVANLATTLATMFSFMYIYLYHQFRKKEIQFEIEKTVNYVPTRIRKTIKQILKVALPISASSLISSFNKNIDSFTIVRLLKKSIGEQEAKIQYGILSGKVDSLCNSAFFANIAFVTVLVPSIAKNIAKNNIDLASFKARKFLKLSLFISIPITIIFFFFPGQVLKMLFPNATNGAIYLKISSVAIIFMLLTQTVNAILQSIGKVNVPPISFGAGMLVKLILNIILIPNKSFGIFGAIIGNITCNVISFFISFIVLFKNLDIKPKFYKKIYFKRGILSNIGE